MKILYVNLHIEDENNSTENLKFVNKKTSWFKDKNELENEIFNAKKMENIHNLKKKTLSINEIRKESLNTNYFNESDVSSLDTRNDVNTDKSKEY